MTDFLILLLALGTFAFIAYPFFFGRRRAAGSKDEYLDELYSNRNTAYSMLKELEFDRSSGILTEDDYRELETRYKQKAITILKDIDEHAAAGSDGDSEIEREIRHARGKPVEGELDAELERQVMARRRAGAAKPPAREAGKFCTRCGAPGDPGDLFCRACGAKIK
ncbi:MAG: hypothetical protein HYX96_08155 [Chloroflexi bacterium]|nr:hypothetical protein [Chloroflexota bacterium]